LDGIAIVQHAIDVRGGYCMSFLAPYAKSLLPPDSTTGTSPSITSVFCAGLLDNLRAARAVIAVRVADEQNLDVAEAEAKRLNALADERRRRREIAVDKDEAFGRSDKVRGEIGAADVIKIAGDAEGRKGRGPLGSSAPRSADVQCEREKQSEAQAKFANFHCSSVAASWLSPASMARSR
jgi:hypothetical protein